MSVPPRPQINFCRDIDDIQNEIPAKRRESSQEVLQRTAVDALTAKRSAVRLGYYHDEFIDKMAVNRTTMAPSTSILMHRGYTGRVFAFEHYTRCFIDDCAKAGFSTAQVVNLGCGMDTLPLRCLAHPNPSWPATLPRFIDVDLPSTVSAKSAMVGRESIVKASNITGHNIGHDSFTSDQYAVISVNLKMPGAWAKVIEAGNIDTTQPVLLLSECFFVYIQPDMIEQFLSDATSSCDTVQAVIYEQIEPHDLYGSAMVNNLQRYKDIYLPGITTAPTLEGQENRCRKAGFRQIHAQDMLSTYDGLLPASEAARIKKLEFLDEYEEWNLLLRHYCVTVAGKGDALGLGSGVEFNVRCAGEKKAAVIGRRKEFKSSLFMVDGE